MISALAIDSGRITGISGQSLPACVRLVRIDVSWGDQQIVHRDDLQ